MNKSSVTGIVSASIFRHLLAIFFINNRNLIFNAFYSRLIKGLNYLQILYDKRFRTTDIYQWTQGSLRIQHPDQLLKVIETPTFNDDNQIKTYGFLHYWINSLDQSRLEKFLLQITGLSQLTEDTITISWKYPENPEVSTLKEQAPTFHVCFNRIDLPFHYREYKDFAMMMNETLNVLEDLSFTGEY